MTSRYEAGEDILDSRDLQERLDELAAQDDDDDEPELDDDERAELAELRELAEVGVEDWTFGATLIHERYFEEYARELAEDIGAIDKDNGWPCYCIDWAWAARDLAMDYTAVEFGGHTYYVR